uniref:Amino acid transporter transmembrane domain-containing protein n=1 Tax=Esox lucius TaxID=8010 RepID=A0A6Q2X9D7_ESOLU
MELQKMNGQHMEFMAERDEFLPGKSPGIKAPQFTDFEGKTSFGMSIFNLSNAIMGSGILGLAYAMSNTGIILFLVLLLFIAILSAYSIHLLLRSAGFVGIRAYEQLGQRAFGQAGKVLAGSIITIHNVGAMSSYLFIVKSELPLVIQAFLGLTENPGQWYLNGKYLIIIVSFFIILPLSLMRHLGYLGYTSGFSLSCMLFFLISVIYKKFEILCPLEKEITSFNHSSYDFCEPKLITINTQTAYTIPILAFAFVCHPEVLPIYTELKNANKKRMQTVANISILAMFVMYGLTAIFGYLTFFGNVESELLHTYIQVDPLDTLILCVRLAVLVAVTLTVPVVLFPIRRALLQLLFPEKPFHWARHVTIAMCLLVVVNLLVIFVPTIHVIFNLSLHLFSAPSLNVSFFAPHTGSTSAPSLIFILPGIFYIRIVPEETEPLKSRPKILAACFAALGFVFIVMSISFLINDWVSGVSRSGGGH